MQPNWNSSCAANGTIDGAKWTATTGLGWTYVNSTNFIPGSTLGEITVAVGQADETIGDFYTWFGFSNTSTCEHHDDAHYAVRAYSSDSNYKFYLNASFQADSSAPVSSGDTLKLERLADGSCKFYVNGVLNYTFPTTSLFTGDCYATCSADRPTSFVNMSETPVSTTGLLLPPPIAVLEI